MLLTNVRNCIYSNTFAKNISVVHLLPLKSISLTRKNKLIFSSPTGTRKYQFIPYSFGTRGSKAPSWKSLRRSVLCRGDKNELDLSSEYYPQANEYSIGTHISPSMELLASDLIHHVSEHIKPNHFHPLSFLSLYFPLHGMGRISTSSLPVSRAVIICSTTLHSLSVARNASTSLLIPYSSPSDYILRRFPRLLFIVGIVRKLLLPLPLLRTSPMSPYSSQLRSFSTPHFHPHHALGVLPFPHALLCFQHRPM